MLEIDFHAVQRRVRSKGPCAHRPVGAAQTVTEDDVAYDHVYVQQIAPDQEGGIRFYEREVLPKIG